jgi:ribonuclease HII|tara:strand:+ start:232 stop:873 length:642 start_codon:yes stop_codon:yes gene_type:complete
MGLDEAGRGSIIGPLLIGGVVIEKSKLDQLSKIGVKDSKLLTPNNRNRLLKLIKNISKTVVTQKICPSEIDEYVSKGKKYRRLNYLEAITMGQIALNQDPDIIYVDAADINPKRFADDIRSILTKDVTIFSAHKADQKYPIVSAASIVAKCERDAEIAKISEENGYFGSGYPSDPRTIKFLEGWFSNQGEAPSFSRKSWKTWEKIKSTSLEDY